MTATDLHELRLSSEAPFNHDEYTIWLYNKIVMGIRENIYQNIDYLKQRNATCIRPLKALLYSECLNIIDE